MAPIAHSKLGPSSAHRWMACAASYRVTRELVDTGSVYAAEGTAAHELAEKVLRNPDSDCLEYLDSRFNGFEVTQEMADSVQEYVDTIRAIPGDLEVEVRVDYTPWVEGGFGTSDAIVFDAENNTLHVWDLKYGKGVEVHAEGSEQGQMYALGAWHGYRHLYDIEKIVIGIHQPRLGHISEWEITVNELLQFAERAHAASLDAMLEDAPFNPGEKQCRWCGFADQCEANAEHHMEVVSQQFNSLEPPSVESLSDEQVAYIVNNAKSVKAWLSKVEIRALQQIETGHNLPGLKLVEGRSLRKWSSEAEVAQLIHDVDVVPADFFVTKMLSPAQAEKVVGKKRFAELFSDVVVKPTGKPTIVPVTDKRKAFDPASALGFEDIT